MYQLIEMFSCLCYHNLLSVKPTSYILRIPHQNEFLSGLAGKPVCTQKKTTQWANSSTRVCPPMSGDVYFALVVGRWRFSCARDMNPGCCLWNFWPPLESSGRGRAAFYGSIFSCCL